MSLPRPSEPEKKNVQGIVFSGFSSFRSCHLLLQFPEGRCDVNRFVEELLPHLQSAEKWTNKPDHFLNMGFTFNGLKATRVPMVQFDIFPVEFRLGPTNYYSQQNLCDLGTSAPDQWVFGNEAEEKRVDCIVHCYGQDDTYLKTLMDRVTYAAGRYGVVEISRYQSSSDLERNFIHFDYRDGINDPKLDWPLNWPDSPGKFTEPGALNNFLVGYPDSAFLPGPNASDATGRFAKDGCYNAFRVFYQDVEAFDKFLDLHGSNIAKRLKISESEGREWIAAKLSGRWRKGSPLVLSPGQHDEKYATETTIDYARDAKGTRCPFSSHTRVTNPRDQKIFEQELPIPQLARRGAPYGKPPKVVGGNGSGEPRLIDYAGERGLIGLFLCGNLGEQFEKVYAWINGNTFSPVFTQRTQDALIANRMAPLANKRFSIPLSENEEYTIDFDDPQVNTQFVITRGTSYCFLPSIEALNQIANTRL
jgi:deferrochelatase/peroxidase EfeB